MTSGHVGSVTYDHSYPGICWGIWLPAIAGRGAKCPQPITPEPMVVAIRARRRSKALKETLPMNVLKQFSEVVLKFNPRPTGGGGLFRAPPLVFLRYLLNRCRYHRQTCSTLSPNIFTHCVKILKSRVSWFGHKWRQSDVMFRRFRAKIRVYGNRRHGCSFKATINFLIWNDVELLGLQNCYLGFWKFWKFLKIFKIFEKKKSFSKFSPSKSKF